VQLILGDEDLFSLSIGKRVLKKDLVPPHTKDAVPVYSANAIETFGYVVRKDVEESEYDTILWGIDGNFNFSYIKKGGCFISTDNCGKINILRTDILPEYLLFALNESKNDESFDRSFRASLANMKQFAVMLPSKGNNSFDINEQRKTAQSFIKLQELRTNLQRKRRSLAN
jgi:Type I restriction modification DNA specificity domain.